MKSTITPALLFFITFSVYSQIGVNTTTPEASSILDVVATNKGVLLPRVELSGTNDTTTIPDPAESLLVYNTATSGDVTPGFYYFNGSEWSVLSTGGSGSSDPGGAQKWSLNGNDLSGGEFIGSTNWSPLQLKVNNSQIALFHPNGGIAYGYGASANNNNSIAIGTNANAITSNEATAVGPSATATGFQSAALGFNASATTNNSTLALGHSALASGFQATAIGYNAQATTNNNSLAIGTNALATGENSTALGMNASVSGQNAMAMGYGATASNPNTLILGNNITDAANWNATKVGIGTSNPTEKLQVNGNIKIVGGSLKIDDGNQGAGKVLMSDANGNATWATPSTSSVQMAETNASSSSTLSQYSPISFGNAVFAEGVNVNSNNFQVTVSGTYRITYAVSVQKSGGGDQNVKFFLTKGWGASNKIASSTSYVFVGNGDQATATATKYVQLNAYNQVYVFTDTTSNNISTLPDGTYFSIELVQAD